VLVAFQDRDTAIFASLNVFDGCAAERLDIWLCLVALRWVFEWNVNAMTRTQ
jgi:hypothetical protein